MNHNTVLWVLQWLVGLYFIAVGVMHFVVPEGLPAMLEWMYDLEDNLHYISGTAEILGGLGLILPGLVKVAPQLTVWAALGLIVVMVAAIIWHAGRDGEMQNIGFNVVNIIVLSYIAYGRARLSPLSGSSA